MTSWPARPTSVCCAVILGNDSNYIGYDPQINTSHGDMFCGKPVSHKITAGPEYGQVPYEDKVELNLCTNHFTWLVTYQFTHPARGYPT
jgi:hypothetical protein